MIASNEMLHSEMGQPFFFDRVIRFEEVDGAGIVFFAHLVRYAHEAMERFFDAIEGGYVGLITDRRVGFPAVKLESEFSAPVRYGDTLRIETTVEHIGRRSVVLCYRMLRRRDEVLCASMRHTVVLTDLDAMCSCEMPADVRALLTRHLRPPQQQDASQ